MKKNFLIFFLFLFALLFLLEFYALAFQLADLYYLKEEVKFERGENYLMERIISRKPKIDIKARAALSLKVNKYGREKVIFEKNSTRSFPIASLTKLADAVLVLEDSKNYPFSKILTISKRAASQANAPIYGNLKGGERKKIAELLHLMLVYSSNDAAFALSEVIGEKNFVAKMNQLARSLELKNTHFQNPTGLDPDGYHFSEESKKYFNYSSAQDLGKLVIYILRNFPSILRISAQKPYFSLENRFESLDFRGLQLVGGKTGYTDEAGGCMITVLKDKNGTYFVNVILGANSSKGRVEEMEKLISLCAS